MDSIRAEVVDTIYGHKDLCIIINEKRIDNLLYEITADEKLLGLYPAWGKDLLCKNESLMIWELLEKEKGTYNIPILLCPDDLDFSCIIICAKVTKKTNTVEWNSIGRVSHANYDLNKELASGILDTSIWTNEYWDRYGNILAWCKVGDEEWSKWISENWNEEQMLRLKNYTNPYIQDDANIEWYSLPEFTFSIEEYNKCLEIFKNEL